MQAMFQVVQNKSPLESCPPKVKESLELAKNKKILDFIKQCWKVNPNDRPRASKLLLHAFLRKSKKEQAKNPQERVQSALPKERKTNIK